MTGPVRAPKSTWICDWTHWQGKVLPAAGVANAVALLNEPRLIPAAFWYLMPGRASAQAGLFYDMLNAFDVRSWCAWLDAEQPGVTWTDIERFAVAWYRLTQEQSLALYTSRRFWGAMPDGATLFPFLEEAHWVPATVRNHPDYPYASQQAKAIDPAWWNVSYGGWAGPSMIQFTDTALVQGVKTTASLYRGTQSQLREVLS